VIKLKVLVLVLKKIVHKPGHLSLHHSEWRETIFLSMVQTFYLPRCSWNSTCDHVCDVVPIEKQRVIYVQSIQFRIFVFSETTAYSLGLSDAFEKLRFVDLKTGTEVPSANITWTSGFPSSSTNANCVYVVSAPRTLVSTSCGDKKRFVCDCPT